MPKFIAELVKNTGGGPCYTEPFPEASGQSFTRGAIVTLNTNGQVKEVSSSVDTILGIAAEAASGTQNTGIKVWLATPESVFSMSVSGSSLPAASDVGQAYNIVKESGSWCVDKTDITNTRVSVIGMDPRDSISTVNGRLLVVFSNTNRQIQF